MMTRGGEGVSIPPKNDDVIYEQPLIGKWCRCTKAAVCIAFGIPSNLPEGFSSPIHPNSSPGKMDAVKEMQ